MKIDGVKIFEPDIFTDYRGDLWTTWKKDEFPIDLDFNHDKVSTSRKHVLRGIHGDFKSWKLVSCLYGKIYFVIVDNRESYDTFMKWESIILDDKHRRQILLPPGIGNGFVVMSDHCVFNYKWSYEGDYPDVDDQFSIKWDDTIIGVDWPIDNPILSSRDK